MSGELTALMAEMKEAEALALAERLLAEGQDPLAVLEECRRAVELVGQRFEEGKYFLPELIMAGEMMKGVAALAEPYLKAGGRAAAKKGKVVLGSVAGDIHDIGKDMVAFMLDVNGFEVINLGVDVAPERFVEAVKEHQPEVVGMSALLTTVIEAIKGTVQALDQAGLRDSVKVMIGGSAVNDWVRDYAGADAFGPDAVAAVNLASGWVGPAS